VEPGGVIPGRGGAPAAPQTDGLEPFLDHAAAVAAGDGRARQHEVGSHFVQRGPLGIDVPHLGDLVVVGGLGIHDRAAHGQHRGVATLEQPFLVDQRHAAHVAVQVEGDVRLARRHLREPDRLVEAQGGTIWARNRPGGGAEFGFSRASAGFP